MPQCPDGAVCRYYDFWGTHPDTDGCRGPCRRSAEIEAQKDKERYFDKQALLAFRYDKDGTRLRELEKFVEDFESQFVCWGMMTPKEENYAVQQFIERARVLTGSAAIGEVKS